jgi:thiol:disulfide interchange protein
METFKHIMGFVLMGTVVFVLTLIPTSLVVPTVAMMIGLWAALWWVGRVPVWDDLHKRVRAWAGGTAFATFIGLISYMWLDGVMESRFQRDVDRTIASRMDQSGSRIPLAAAQANGAELPWQPYSHNLLGQMLAEKRTVFVDFTADWCQTCKFNEKMALNVADTKAFVEANKIATLKADMTHEAPDADELKARLGGSSIPFYAVFPAASPKQPIVFDGLITKTRVLETLKKAVALNVAVPAQDVAKN